MPTHDRPIDPYTWPHKMLRRILFDTTALAGTADVDDTTAMRELETTARHTLDLVELHAEHEETFLHPVVARRMPDFVRALETEHAAGRAQVTQLRDLLGLAVDADGAARRAEAALAFYRSLGRFTAGYLAHLDEEEAALPRYWSTFTAGELGDVMRRFNAARSPAEAMTSLEHMLPALTPAERDQLLTAIRSSAPPQGFRAACGVARRVLDEAAWQKLRACVEVP